MFFPAPTSSTGGEHATFYDTATTGQQPGTTSSTAGNTNTSQGYGTTSSGGPDTGTSQEYGTTSDRHPVRDAAAVGTGAGALGAGAHGFEKHRAPQDTTTGWPTAYGPTTGNTTRPHGYQSTPATTDSQMASQPY